MGDIADPTPGLDPEGREETLGRVLYTARNAQGVSIEQLALQLRIDSRFVEALEEDRLDVFAAPVFVRGYLRQLAVRLGLEYEDLLARYNAATGEEKPPIEYTRPVSRPRRAIPRRIIVTLILLLGAAAIGFRWINRDAIMDWLSWEARVATQACEGTGRDLTELEEIPGPGVPADPMMHDSGDAAGMTQALSVETGHRERSGSG